MSKLKKPKKIRDPNIALKGRILSALRRLTWSWGPIREADDEAKVAPATYECALCGKWCYTGKSVKSYEELRDSRPDKNIQMEARYRDHIEPIFEIMDNYIFSWDTIIERMFCEKQGIAILCFSCHDKKTKDENEERYKLRNLEKNRKYKL